MNGSFLTYSQATLLLPEAQLSAAGGKALLSISPVWFVLSGKRSSHDQGTLHNFHPEVHHLLTRAIARAGGLQELNATDEVLVTVQNNLAALKELLDKSPHLFHSTPGDHTGARSAAVSEQEAWKVFISNNLHNN